MAPFAVRRNQRTDSTTTVKSTTITSLRIVGPYPYSFGAGPRQWSSIRKASSTPAENAHTNAGASTIIASLYPTRTGANPDAFARDVLPVGVADMN